MFPIFIRYVAVTALPYTRPIEKLLRLCSFTQHTLRITFFVSSLSKSAHFFFREISGLVIYLVIVAILYSFTNPDWSWFDSWHYRLENYAV